MSSWIETIQLDKILTSLDLQEFLLEVTPHFVSEEIRLNKMLESVKSDEVSSAMGLFAGDFLDILLGAVPVKSMFNLLVSKVSLKILEIYPEMKDNKDIAYKIVMILVSRAYEKSSKQKMPEEVAKDKSSSLYKAYPILNAITNCGLFTKASDPEVFLHSLAGLGYKVKGYGDANAKS